VRTGPAPFFSLAGPAAEETDQFGNPEDRARDLETIRLEYLECKKTGRLPGVADPVSHESHNFPNPGTEPDTDPYAVLLKEALEEVDYVDLNLLLNLVLTELRVREADQMKEDILTHSKKLHLIPDPEAPAPPVGEYF
jgi:hypothetical protein